MQIATILGGWKMHRIALCIHIAAITNTAIHEDGIHSIQVLLTKRGVTKGTLKRSTTGIDLPVSASRLGKAIETETKAWWLNKRPTVSSFLLSNSIELTIFVAEIVQVLYEDGQKAMSIVLPTHHGISNIGISPFALSALDHH